MFTIFQTCPLYSLKLVDGKDGGIPVETKSCEYITFQEASRLMILQENTVLIPKEICMYADIFVPENTKFGDYKNAFLHWNIVVTRNDDDSDKLLAISLSSTRLVEAGSLCFINLFGNNPDLMVKHGFAHLDQALKVAHRHKGQQFFFIWTSWDHDDYMRNKFSAVMGSPENKEHSWGDLYYTVETGFCWFGVDVKPAYHTVIS